MCEFWFALYAFFLQLIDITIALHVDDSAELDALQTLADLSLMMPASTMESGKYFVVLFY